MHWQPGKLHFLLSGEVFSGFFILTPFNEKATKVSYLPLRLKDFLIFCIVLFFSIIPHFRSKAMFLNIS
jgi:hypothetical protein